MKASLSSPPASSPSCLPFTFATLVASAQVETVMMNAMNTLKDKNLNPGLGWEITDGMNVNLVQQNITDSCIIPTPGGGTFGVVGVAAGTSGRWSVGRGVARDIPACSTANTVHATYIVFLNINILKLCEVKKCFTLQTKVHPHCPAPTMHQANVSATAAPQSPCRSQRSRHSPPCNSARGIRSLPATTPPRATLR